MKNLKNVLATTRSNRGLFLKLSVFALFGIMILFSGQTLAQSTCTPTLTVTEGNLAPGGPASFTVLPQAGGVSIDHVGTNVAPIGTGLRSLTLLPGAINVTITSPVLPFISATGEYNPVVVNFTPTDPTMPVDFTLRAASLFHAANIRVQCPRTLPAAPVEDKDSN